MQNSVTWCPNLFVFFSRLDEGKGGRVRSFGHEPDFCQANKAENTDPRTNSAAKYATARGHWIMFFQQCAY